MPSLSIHYNSIILFMHCIYLYFCFFFAAFFSLVVFLSSGPEVFLDFVFAYFFELLLSLDNAFVFVVIFKYFQICHLYQSKVLYFGIIGALISRLIIISLAIYIVDISKYMFLFFGVFLVFSGIKLQKVASLIFDFKNSLIHRLISNIKIIDYKYDERKFFYIKNKSIIVTQFGLAFIMVEKADLVFAFDSVPVILSITNDLFIAFSSNVFAVLALRSIYFVLSNSLDKFYYLKNTVSSILIYVGLKMILSVISLNVNNDVSFIITSIVFSIGLIVSIIRVSIFNLNK